MDSVNSIVWIAIPKADKSRAISQNPFEEDGFVCKYNKEKKKALESNRFLLVTSGSSLKFPSSLQSDSEWTPLSPVSYQGPSLMNGTPPPSVEKSPSVVPINSNSVSSVIGFWNNKQSS